MLAYVFWHWKQPGVAVSDYETRQRAFHAVLSAAPPVGFQSSFSVALSGAPWAAESGEAYEDWYLVQDFVSLGRLNEAAVSASRSAPHDAAASLAANGTAGLYALRGGSIVRRPRYAYWFRKPEGMRYGELDTQIGPLLDQSRGALWMRQMTLGPTPEFCLHAAAPVELVAPFSPLALPLRSIWPEPTSI